jgi:hypothetical protein
MNMAVFLDLTRCGACKSRHFGGTYRLHHEGGKNQRARNKVSGLLQLIVIANVVHSSLILSTLMIDAILRNVRFYNGHKASLPRRRHSSI